MIKWLQDSYNGIYKVLLKPYMPRWSTLLALVIGVIIGLIIGYGIAPTVYYDADPRTLEQSWQDEWVKLLADRYANATTDVTALTTDLLARVDDPLGIVQRLLATPGEEANAARLQALLPLAEAAQPFAVSEPPRPTLLGNLSPWLLGPLLTAILAAVVVVVYGMFIEPNVVQPLRKRLRGEKVSAEVAAMRRQIEESKKAETSLKTDFAQTSLGKPIMQRVSTYQLGFGEYDDSFSIEDENGRFFGECGATISETFGVGEPRKATAIEVWLFDKEDFVRTITKVFVSQHAFNDPALRAKLELKGDLVLATPGATVILETNTLRLQARVADIKYGEGPQPPQSYFERLSIELAVWHKDGAKRRDASGEPADAMMTGQPAPAPVTPAAMPTLAPAQAAAPRTLPPATPPASASPAPTFAPPPMQPATFTPPPSPPPVRSSPPPPPPPIDDDPFGGTGDFRPTS
ncbi:MAG: hypothetical protein ACUVS2_09355 [Candidatus Flexifilum sp.]